MWKKLFNRPQESSGRVASDEIPACQDDLVRAVADSITDLHDGEWENREWLRIVVNHEALWAQPAPRTSSLGFVIARRPGGPPPNVSVLGDEQGYREAQCSFHQAGIAAKCLSTN